MSTTHTKAVEHIDRWSNCTNCRIGELSYRHVFYRGDLPCDILFIGEAPGKTEDTYGTPFRGACAEIMDSWMRCASPLIAAVTNMVACRPCDWSNGPNRPPNASELLECRPRLLEFVDLSEARGLVLCGKVAEGALYSYTRQQRIPVIALPHPAFILRQGGMDTHEYNTAVEHIKKFRSTLRKA